MTQHTNLKRLIWILFLLFALAIIWFGRAMELGLFIIIIWIALIFHFALAIWWYLDIRDRQAWDPESKKFLFYVFNYPDTLWAFVQYLLRRSITGPPIKPPDPEKPSSLPYQSPLQVYKGFFQYLRRRRSAPKEDTSNNKNK